MDEFQRASTGLSTNDEAKKSANAIFQVCSGFENSHASTSTLAMCNAKVASCSRAAPLSQCCTHHRSRIPACAYP